MDLIFRENKDFDSISFEKCCKIEKEYFFFDIFRKYQFYQNVKLSYQHILSK